MSVVEGYVDPAATPEGVKLTDVDVPPRNQVIGGVLIAGMIVKGMGVTSIGHGETPVRSGLSIAMLVLTAMTPTERSAMPFACLSRRAVASMR